MAEASDRDRRVMRESYPLLPTNPGGHQDKQGYVNHGFNAKIKINKHVDFWEDKDSNEDKDLFSYDRKRGTSMIVYDCFLVILDYLQIFSLLQSLGLRWPWPKDWIQSTSWIFAFNIDIWDLTKVYTNGTYQNVKDRYVPSAEMPYQYWQLLVGWAAVLFIAAAIYAITYIVLNVHKHPYMMVHIAHLQRALVVAAEVLALPLGVTLANVFHCKPDASVLSNKQLVDVSNDLQCFDEIHWGYIAPALLVVFLLFIVLPIWLIINIRQEILAASSDQHEGFLQLKETEYLQGLDMVFIVKGYPLFSSFSLWGVYYRPSLLMLKLALVVFYATLFQHSFAQALVINLLLAIMFIAYAFVRPFRVKPFNFMLAINYFCLMGNCLLGTMLTSFDSFTVQSPWLTPTYMIYILLFINGFWILCCFIFLVYIILRHLRCLKRWIKEPLWPSMTSRGLDKLKPETRKFMRGILHARHLLERTLSMPPIFAPAHELSRQIQIINAYCREAELLQDPIHPTLWDLLDDMIEAYSQISPKSLFSESVKDSIRQTAGELMKIMPMFVRRLAQREYDMILMNPVKRRMLLKMYCMGLFLNGRAEKVKKEKVNVPAIRKIWRKRSVQLDNDDDDGYYEDMYPERMLGPNYQRPETMIDLHSDPEDDEYLEDLDVWTQQHPASRGGPSRLSDDLSRLLGDDVSLNLSEMMAGVPSLSSSSSANSRPASNASRLVRPSTANSASRSHSRASRSTGQVLSPTPSPPTTTKEISSVTPSMTTSTPARPTSALSQTTRVESRPSSALSQTTRAEPRPSSALSQTTRAEPRPSSALSQTTKAEPRPSSALSQTTRAEPRPSSALSQTTRAEPRPSSALSQTTRAEHRPSSALSQTTRAEPRPSSALSQTTRSESRPSSALSQTSRAEPRPSSALSQTTRAEPRPSSALSQTTNVQERPTSALSQTEKKDLSAVVN